MFRISAAIVTIAICAGAALPAVAQMGPPPPAEGPSMQGDPYGRPAADPRATPIPDAVLTAQAKKVFGQLQNGRVDSSEISTTTPNSNMNAATIANAQRMVGNLGKPVSFVQQRTTSENNMTAALYLVTFSNGQKIEFLYMVDSAGKVAGLGLGTPH